jgi:hypothetical protein
MKIKLGFFIGAAMVTASFACYAQSNSLGDRAPEAASEQPRKIQKQRITRKQKLLFRKPNVRHTAQYEYFARVEQLAHEKSRVARKKKELIKIPYVRHQAEYEFYKRVELAAKNKQRMLIAMAKPQYSNFAYFGHKHPPKKHLPYAMRYCKECGMRH